MTYELWDARSGNRLAAFPTQAEVVQLVREMVALNGPSETEDLFVEAIEGTESRVLLRRDDLLRLVREEESPSRQARGQATTMSFRIEFDANYLARPFLVPANTAEAAEPESITSRRC